MVAVEQACCLPGDPGRSTEEALGFLRNQPPTHETCNWLAGGGYASLYIHGTKATFLHLQVHPDVTWPGRVPEHHLDAFARARKSMDDAPGSDEIDYPTATAERVRAEEATLAARGSEMRVTIAMGNDGVVGAFTELRWSPGSTAAFTDDTGTVAEFRGLGLAKAVKIEPLRRLHADRPHIVAVKTNNAEDNAAMRHINATVGFRPFATFTQATISL